MIEEAKSKASEILRDATDEAKRVAIETEELKRQSRVFTNVFWLQLKVNLA